MDSFQNLVSSYAKNSRVAYNFSPVKTLPRITVEELYTIDSWKTRAEALLAAGANVDEVFEVTLVDVDNRTITMKTNLLCLAAEYGDVEMIKLCHQYKADHNIAHTWKATARGGGEVVSYSDLKYAINITYDAEILAMLLENGADPDILCGEFHKKTISEYTPHVDATKKDIPLLFAIATDTRYPNWQKLAEVLISHKANVNFTHDRGNTALESAITYYKSHNLVLARMLLAAGARQDLGEKFGREHLICEIVGTLSYNTSFSPAQLVASATLLFEFGAKVDQRFRDSNKTLLFGAHMPEIRELLLERGAKTYVNVHPEQLHFLRKERWGRPYGELSEIMEILRPEDRQQLAVAEKNEEGFERRNAKTTELGMLLMGKEPVDPKAVKQLLDDGAEPIWYDTTVMVTSYSRHDSRYSYTARNAATYTLFNIALRRVDDPNQLELMSVLLDHILVPAVMNKPLHNLFNAGDEQLDIEFIRNQAPEALRNLILEYAPELLSPPKWLRHNDEPKKPSFGFTEQQIEAAADWLYLQVAGPGRDNLVETVRPQKYYSAAARLEVSQLEGMIAANVAKPDVDKAFAFREIVIGHLRELGQQPGYNSVTLATDYGPEGQLADWLEEADIDPGCLPFKIRLRIGGKDGNTELERIHGESKYLYEPDQQAQMEKVLAFERSFAESQGTEMDVYEEYHIRQSFSVNESRGFYATPEIEKALRAITEPRARGIVGKILAVIEESNLFRESYNSNYPRLSFTHEQFQANKQLPGKLEAIKQELVMQARLGGPLAEAPTFEALTKVLRDLAQLQIANKKEFIAQSEAQGICKLALADGASLAAENGIKLTPPRETSL